MEIEKIEKQAKFMYPPKNRLGDIAIRIPQREDINYEKREAFIAGCLWAIYELGNNIKEQ